MVHSLPAGHSFPSKWAAVRTTRPLRASAGCGSSQADSGYGNRQELLASAYQLRDGTDGLGDLLNIRDCLANFFVYALQSLRGLLKFLGVLPELLCHDPELELVEVASQLASRLEIRV